MGALRFGVREAVTFEAMEDVFPFVLGHLGKQLLKKVRPDWDTVVIRVERGTFPRSWVVRLECEGGGRDCIARGAK